MEGGRRSSWDEEDDRQERLYLEGARVHEIGLRTLELASRDSSESHSVVQNSLGLLREIADPISRLQTIDALGEELVHERARIIREL